MTFQTRTRDPLLDSRMQETLQKRGTELIGFAMLAVALVFGIMLWSYSPDDAIWVSGAAHPPSNALGGLGATLSSRMILTIGLASWALPALLGVWGLRFVAHKGDERLMARGVTLPIFVALSAIFLACQTPPAVWTHGFSLGGLFGDAVLGVLLDLMPLGTRLDLFVLTLLFSTLFVGLGSYVFGYSKAELAAIRQQVLVSVILTYDSLMLLGARVLSMGQAGAGQLAERRAQRRTAAAAAAAAAAADTEAAKGAFVTGYAETPPSPGTEYTGIFRMPVLGHAAPQPTVDPEPIDPASQDDARIHNRISNAVQAKVLRAQSYSEEQQAQSMQPVEDTALFEDVDDDPDENIFRDDYDPLPDTAPALPGATRAFQENRSLPPVPQAISPEGAAQAAVGFASRRSIDEPAEPVVKRDTRKKPAKSAKAKAEEQPSLFAEKSVGFETPPLSLLRDPDTIERHHLSDEALEANARMLESVLDDYGVKGDIVSVRPGPVVTMYELEPAPGLKASRVIGLADDIARSMSALSARVSTVPGRSIIGIELPNEQRETVLLREILATRDYGDGDQKLPLALGKDISGQPVVANLAKMPHLLIAGTTGSGKSVAINTMILSLLYRLTPDDCRLIMIDPKMLELSVYDGIPHLLSPVVTDPKKAVVALKWVVGEMEERYRKMSKMGVRNILGYNAKVADALKDGRDFERTVQTGFDDETGEPVHETEKFTPEKMPYIVVVVDEMADLMMVAGKEIEACIQRLAQMARASGIHLIMATQRPSVDVITGTIKANFPTRISFQVTSKVDSRTILGEMGAEQLLGMGDMLYMAGGGKITRIHAPFASDEEVEEVVNALKVYGPPDYVGGVAEGPDDDKSEGIDLVLGLGGNTGGEDALYDQAVAIVARDRKCSTSYIQRKLAIGYNKAARLVEQMEDNGVVGSANAVGKREILVPEA